MYVTGGLIGQGRVLDHLEQELQMAVSHHLSAGNRTLILWESNNCSAILSALVFDSWSINSSIILWLKK